MIAIETRNSATAAVTVVAVAEKARPIAQRSRSCGCGVAMPAVANPVTIVRPVPGGSAPADSVRALIALHRADVLGAERLVSAAERAAAAGAPAHRRDLMVLARARVLEASGRAEAALDALAGAFVGAGAVSDQPLVGVELARIAALAGRPDDARATVPALERLAALNPGVRSLEAAALQARGPSELREPARSRP